MRFAATVIAIVAMIGVALASPVCVAASTCYLRSDWPAMQGEPAVPPMPRPLRDLLRLNMVAQQFGS
jgi:hypothetical protein